MKLTTDESRALAFIAGLLLLSAAVRIGAAREALGVPAAGGFEAGAHVEATRAAVAAAERAALPMAPGERLDPNTADAVELDRLPRVGPALAARIVEDRERNGRFRSIQDIGRVRGIGERMLEEIGPHLALPRGSPTEGGSPRPGAADRTGVDRSTGAAAGNAAGSGSAPPQVDINRADTTALATLPGIGPVLAARIVAYRDSAGPFPDVDALLGVKGIGPAGLERLRPLVRVGRP